MRKLKLKEIVIVTSLSVILTGCANQAQIPDNNYQNKIVLEESIEDIVSSEPIIERPQNNNQNIVEEEIQELSYFEDAKEDLRRLAASDEYQKIKTKGKEYFIKGIDFIFFDEPINGIYFSDLTTEMKIYAIEEMIKIDRAIMEYHPYYKEEISEKYNVAAEFLDTQYLNVLDKIKEYLGEENYNAIGDIKDKVADSAANAYEDATSYIKKFYNDWKNK